MSFEVLGENLQGYSGLLFSKAVLVDRGRSICQVGRVIAPISAGYI